MRLVAGVLCLMTVLFLSGCGGGGEDTSLIEGKVLYSTGEPLEKGVVVLTGEKGSFRAKIEEAGAYKIEDVPAGDYQVTITGTDAGSDDGDGMNYDADGNYIEKKEGPAPKPLIDAKYTDLEKSGLSLTVPGTYDLEVVAAQ